MHRIVRIAAVVAIIATLVAVGPEWATAASPSLTAPTRVYGTVNQPLPFTPGAKDAISDQELDITVELADLGDTCDTSAGNNYDITTCPRVQMQVNQGVLAIDVDTDLTDAALPDGVAAGGAIFESTNGNGTGPVINLNGTDTQINAALDTLVYAPDTDAENDLLTPFLLDIKAIDDDNATADVDATVQIRIDEANEGPSLTVPATQNVAASSSTPLPASAPAFTTPPTPGDWNVEDPDVKEGVPDSMLLVMFATCGTFELRGSSLPIEGLITDALDNYAEDLYGNDPSSQSERDALVATILAVIPPEALAASIETSAPNVAKTGYAGIGTVDDLVYLLSQVTFNAPAAPATCELWTVVTDLGNDGLPLEYHPLPDDGDGNPQVGIEVPDLGVDYDITTYVVDGGVTLSVPSDLTVAEGATLNIPVSIDTAEHPDIPVGFASTDVTTTAADYSLPAAFVYPENDAGPVNATFTATTDSEVEGDESVYVSLEVAGDGVKADPDTVLITITDATETTTTTTESTTTTSTPGGTTTIPNGSTTTTTDPGTTTTTDPGTTTTTDPGTTTTTDPGTTTSTSTTTTSTTTTSTTSTTTSTSTTTTSTPGSTTTTDPGTTTTTDPGTTTSTPDGSTTTTVVGSTTTTSIDGSTTTTEPGETTTTAPGETTTTAAGGTTTDPGDVSGGGGSQGGGSGGTGVDDGTLARTGSDTRSLFTMALVTVTLGAVALVARRRLHLRNA
jgi:hypothetical protein